MSDRDQEVEAMIDEEVDDFDINDEILGKKKPKVVKEKKAKEERIKSTNINPLGKSFYGEKFVNFDKLEVIRDLIPKFKDFYYAKKFENLMIAGHSIAKEFNDTLTDGRTFFPYLANVKAWRIKWDLDIANQIKEQKGEDSMAFKKISISQVIATRDERDKLTLGSVDDQSLEAGVRSLGGELLNDALQMLRDDQEIGEIYKDETLIKRRNYIVNVFAHATKLVHGKAALMLKASEEKRNNASFLMTLMAKATAGKLSDEELSSMKTTYSAPIEGEVIAKQDAV